MTNTVTNFYAKPLLQISGATTVFKIHFTTPASKPVASGDFIVLEFPTKSRYKYSTGTALNTGIASNLLFAEDLGGGLGTSLSTNDGH